MVPSGTKQVKVAIRVTFTLLSVVKGEILVSLAKNWLQIITKNHSLRSRCGWWCRRYLEVEYQTTESSLCPLGRRLGFCFLTVTEHGRGLNW